MDLSSGANSIRKKRSRDSYSEMMDSFDQIFYSTDFNNDMKEFLLSGEWSRYCTDYEFSSGTVNYFEKLAAMGERCDTSVMKTFMGTCGYGLSNWELQFGTFESLSLILQHAERSKFKLWRDVARSTSNPIVWSLYGGRWRNVDLLLGYGYSLEQEDYCAQVNLVETVFREISTSSEVMDRMREVKLNPHSKRCFLKCLLMRSYLYEDDFPETGCDEAIMSIWKRLPDSYLTKDEFLTILDPFPAKTNLLADMYDRYINTVCDGDISLTQQPRTLSHYIRCTVRQKLSMNCLFPDGVQELPISTTLKNYLLFK